MAKIFEQDTFKHGGSFRRGKSGAMFSANGKIALVQNWSATFQLPIQEIYECGSSNVYFAATAPQGTFQVNRVVSGKGLDLDFDLCRPKSVTLAQDSGCDAENVTLTLESCVLQSVAWSGQAANAYIEEQVSLKFIGASKS